LAHKVFQQEATLLVVYLSEIYPSGGLTVDILDTKTGEQTQVIIKLILYNSNPT
jgi:hypothetical protein